jgi:hypothetical protein
MPVRVRVTSLCSHMTRRASKTPGSIRWPAITRLTGVDKGYHSFRCKIRTSCSYSHSLYLDERICSLSKTFDSHLLWAHYASGFSGLAVEVELPDHAHNVRVVEYRGVFGRVSFDRVINPEQAAEESQADYVQGNSDFDNEIDAITEQLKASQSQRGTLDAFLRFSNLMLVDIAAAWQQAEVEQRVRVQNFLFQDGIAYEQTDKFLNTPNPTLFQQLRDLAHCKEVVGVPDGI